MMVIDVKNLVIWISCEL